jgi:hypothetical protein
MLSFMSFIISYTDPVPSLVNTGTDLRSFGSAPPFLGPQSRSDDVIHYT